MQNEKDEATNTFIEDFTSKKFEMIAEVKAELKFKLSQIEDLEQKQQYESQYKLKLSKLEQELAAEKEKAMTEIKIRFHKRKQSIMGKIDMESAKSKLKASLTYGKNMSFLSTPSSQSFHLSPYEASATKAQQIDTNLGNKEQMFAPVEKLIFQPEQSLRMPKTPNRMAKMDFDFVASYSANK